MSFVHGSSTHALVNEVLVSGEVNGWSLGWNRQMSEVTTIGQPVGNAGSNFVPGLQSGTLGLRGPQQADPLTGLTAKIQQAIGVDNAFQCTALPDGFAIGKPAMFMVGDPTEYAVDAQVADAVGMTFTAQADESVEMGYVIASGVGATTALVPYTADALTGTAVDRGASPLTPTTRGLAAAVHVTAYSGFTGVLVKVQHSPDNSAWADLASFTNITAVGREKISVPIGTTVNRYLRASVDVTGSGSVTLLVAAAPR
jgi:hypothetical protein